MIKDIALALDFYGEHKMNTSSASLDRYDLLNAIKRNTLGSSLGPSLWKELKELIAQGFVNEYEGILKLTDEGFRQLEYMEKRKLQIVIPPADQKVREA